MQVFNAKAYTICQKEAAEILVNVLYFYLGGGYFPPHPPFLLQ